MDTHGKNIEIARDFVAAIEKDDLEALVSLCCRDIKQIEWPNLLNPSGAERDLAGMIDGFERGREVLSGQTYVVISAHATAQGAALEMAWRGKLAVAIGDLAAGDEMTGHIAMFMTFRDGKIATCHNYDCFDPF